MELKDVSYKYGFLLIIVRVGSKQASSTDRAEPQDGNTHKKDLTIANNKRKRRSEDKRNMENTHTTTSAPIACPCVKQKKLPGVIVMSFHSKLAEHNATSQAVIGAERSGWALARVVQASRRDRLVAGTQRRAGEAVRRDAQTEQGGHVEQSRARAVTCQFRDPCLDDFVSLFE